MFNAYGPTVRGSLVLSFVPSLPLSIHSNTNSILTDTARDPDSLSYKDASLGVTIPRHKLLPPQTLPLLDWRLNNRPRDHMAKSVETAIKTEESFTPGILHLSFVFS